MFITLEGIEGSGKTTQMEFIRGFLTTRSIDCAVTREPGGTPTGKKIRSILLDPEGKDLSPDTELLLYTADRLQHIREVISPSLRADKTVLCDRYFDATLAYQGYARGLDRDRIRDLHRLLCDGLTPDLTLLFDLTPEEGLARAWRQIHGGERSCAESRFEQEALEFHQKVRDGYLTLAALEPARFRIIDAAQNLSDVQRQVTDVLTDFLAKRHDFIAQEAARL